MPNEQRPANGIEILSGIFALPSGALWVAEDQALLVADVHLGYGWAQRRRGQLGPLADHRAAEKLFQVLDQWQPKRLVAIGDLVHAPRPAAGERQLIEEALSRIAARAECILVQGNHDRHFHRDFASMPVDCRPVWHGDSVTAVHGDRNDFPWPEGHRLVMGHWHPSVSIRDAAGARQRLPSFLSWPHVIVLPAFSPFAAGFDVSRGFPREMLRAIPDSSRPVEVYAASGRRIQRIAKLAPKPRPKAR